MIVEMRVVCSLAFAVDCMEIIIQRKMSYCVSIQEAQEAVTRAHTHTHTLSWSSDCQDQRPCLLTWKTVW